MNYSDHRFTLDVQLHQAQVSIPATLNDTARRLCVGLTNGRKPYVIANGCTAAFAAKKPDGLGIFNACTIEGNTIIYEFTPQTTNVIGTYECEIRLYDTNGLQLTSPRFLLVVDEQAISDDTVIDSFSEATMLTQIVASELERQSNEEQRQTNEINRQTAEDDREENENARIKNEGERQEAETARAEAFSLAQIARDQNYQQSMESMQADFEAAEVERQSNEKQRQSNENERISKDAERDGKIASIEALVGNIDATLDYVLAIQESLIGGDA